MRNLLYFSRPRLNVESTGRVSPNFYTQRSKPYTSSKKHPKLKEAQEVEDILNIRQK